ncbi:MAG: heavy metal translocating P-type ATPase [Chroococcales cyanobacterium]
MAQSILKSDSIAHSKAKAKAKLSVISGSYDPVVHSEVTYQIIHATPGRIRFRIPRLISDSAYTERLQGLIDAESKITRVRFRQAAGSMTVFYASHLETEREIICCVRHLLQRAINPSLPQKSLAQSQSSWAGLRIPAIATGLSLLPRLLGFSFPPIFVGSAIAAAAIPIALRTWESITCDRRLNVDFLDLSAVSIITAQGHFFTAASMITLIELGEAIRERTARSTQNHTLDLLSSLAQYVWVESNGEKQAIPIEDVKRGDIVIVYPGEQIPVDGRIVRGKALIDEQKLTGESMPEFRHVGEKVYATTLVREGQIYIETKHTGADTRAGRTVALIQSAPVHDTRVENYAAKIADRAVLPTLLLGGLVFAATRSPARAASVLTIDFATGIRVSVPTTVMAAMTAAARRGILIRSGRALEKLAEINAVVFDKTGTLTQGDVTIVEIKTANSAIPESRVLELAAAAEQRLTHPIATAILRRAEAEGLEVLPRGEWHYHVGLGIEVKIEDQTVLVGSERFLEKEGVNVQPLYDRHPELKTIGYPLIFVACDGEIQGALEYADPLRPESRDVIVALRDSLGAEIQMLTGDHWQRAKEVAKALNIREDHVHAEAFPEDKAKLIQQLHEDGKTVGFVGDGLNDSAALAYADLSVSFRDGSEIARETADVVLMTNDLRSLVEAIAIARQAQQIINQNATLVAVPNLFGLVLAGTVGINPMAATMINNGSSVIAGMNGLRPIFNGHKALD